MTRESHPACLELIVPGLDHDRNLQLVVSKQDRFSRSSVASGSGRHSGYQHVNRNSLSLVDDPDVARISGAIESHITARLAAILETLHEPTFRVGKTSASCVCFRDGSYFRRHMDVVKRREGKRRLTWVYYLNSEPKQFSGGDLLVDRPNLGRMLIEPAHGRIVVFRSELSHEVTPVRLSPDHFGDARFSITGFIGDQPTLAERVKSYSRRLRGRFRRRKSKRRRQPAATTL